jgi:hypothetical protein
VKVDLKPNNADEKRALLEATVFVGIPRLVFLEAIREINVASTSS